MLRPILNHPGSTGEFYKTYIRDYTDLIYQAWADISTFNIRNSWNKIINSVSEEEVEEAKDIIEPPLCEIIGQISGQEARWRKFDEDEEKHRLEQHREEELKDVNHAVELNTENENEEEAEGLEEAYDEVTRLEEIKQAFATIAKYSKYENEFVKAPLLNLKKTLFDGTKKE